jgi:hypothetical protein
VYEKHLAVGPSYLIEFGWTGGVASAVRKTSISCTREPAANGSGALDERRDARQRKERPDRNIGITYSGAF